MQINKYLVHDVYHVTKNLTILKGYATEKEIVEYTKKTGEKNGKNYTTNEIKKYINYLETIRTIKQTKKGQYEAI